MSKENETLNYMKGLMDEHNNESSYGVIMLHNGMMINVRSRFIEISNYWKLYKIAKAMKDEDLLKEIMENTGGLLDTNDVSIDINHVAAMFPVFVYYENKDIAKQYFKNDRKIQDYLMRTLNLYGEEPDN